MAKVLLFTGFYLFAIINKRNTPFHMRYMIATALVFVEPIADTSCFFLGEHELFAIFFIFIFADRLILIALIFFDKMKQLNYKPYAVALTGFCYIILFGI